MNTAVLVNGEMQGVEIVVVMHLQIEAGICGFSNGKNHYLLISGQKCCTLENIPVTPPTPHKYRVKIPINPMALEL